MSVSSEIKLIFADTKTFAEKAEAEFVKLFKASPTVLQDLSTFVAFASPVVIDIEAIVAPEEAPLTVGILATIKADLATLSAAAQSVSTASTAAQALTNLAAAVPQLLSVGEIKDSALVSKIEGYVSLVTGELNAVVPAVEAYLIALKA